jgi:hypothetical protein
LSIAALPRRTWPGLAALALAVLALVAVTGFGPILSYDYWWHLRTGDLILATGTVPRADPYTYTAEGSRWIDVHWLFQVMIAAVHRIAGHEGVRVAKGLSVLLLAGLAGSIGFRREHAAVSALAVAAMLLAARERFMERPELPTFLLLAALLALLYRYERSPSRLVYAIVPLQLVWANLHGLFAVGIAVCALALAAELVRPLFVTGAELRRERVRDLAAVSALSLAVSFLNPNGAATVLYPLGNLGMIGSSDRGLGEMIRELRPILEVPGGPAQLALATGPALLALILNRRRLAPFDALLWVAFTFLALRAERNVALAAVACVPVFVRNANAVLDASAPAALPRAAAAALVAVGLTAAAAVLARAPESRPEHRLLGPPLLELRFPEAAADWIERERPPGPIFHAAGDGGYLIWRLWPAYPVMVDGRLEVFGEERYAQLRTAHAGTPQGFRALDARFHFGTALLHHRFFPQLALLRMLLADPGWRLVQLDEVSALFVRAKSDGGFAWPALDIAAPDLFAPLPIGPDPVLDQRRREVRSALFEVLGRR